MHVFITGGTRGIGFALVNEFLQQGHMVSATGTSDKSITKAGFQDNDSLKAYVLDVRSKNDIERIAKASVGALGPIDIWINNAGVPQNHDEIGNLSLETTDRLLDVNVKGMVYGTQVALTIMKEQGHGIVYNMEGLGSNGMVISGEVLYGGSKRFLTYFSKGANKELKNDPEIQVGTLQPGMVFTEFLMDNMSEEGLPIARILGAHANQVAVFLVKNMLKGKRKISYLTNGRMMWRFLKYPFVRQNKDVTL